MNAISIRFNKYTAYVNAVLFPSLLLVLLCGTKEEWNSLSISLDPLTIYPALMILGVAYISIFWANSLTFDLTSILLTCRIILLALPLLYTDHIEGYTGNYFSVLVAAFSYFAASNIRGVEIGRVAKKITIVVGIVISLQLAFQAINSISMGVPARSIEETIDIPIGKSNSVASYLLLCFFYIYIYMKKRMLKASILTTFMLALLITFSIAGLVTLVIMIFIIVPLIARKKNILWLLIGLSCLLLLINFYVPEILDSYLGPNRWYPGISIDDASNGRLGLYSLNIEKFLRHPLLGNGLGFPSSTTNVLEGYRAHNIILEALVQGGVLNLIIIFIAIYFPLKNAYPFAKYDRTILAILISCIAVLIHGMAEPNLFSFTMDIYFWTFLGLGTARIRELSKKSLG